MINSEKELEDYICENQDDFIEKLKEIYHTKEEIKFVGRQVHIGEHNIADLIYCYNIKEKIKDEKGNIVYDGIIKNFIIVELKFRQLRPTDLSQLSRYMTTFQDKVLSEKKFDNQTIYTCGILVGFGLDDDMQEIEMLLSRNGNNIEFIAISSKLEYDTISYSHKEKYIENLKLDDRITNEINIK